jgi:hypothetical protein
MANITKRRDNIYKPKGWSPPDDRKERFHKLNAFVRSRDGWIVSVPGDPQVRMECLPGSTLPDELRDAGYDPELIGEGERIIAGTIVERRELSAAGAFEPATEGSTRPVAEARRHAGIVRVVRFTLALP